LDRKLIGFVFLSGLFVVSLVFGEGPQSSPVKKDDFSVVSAGGIYVDVYFFYGEGCPHCANVEPFIAEMEQKYPLRVYGFDIYNNRSCLSLFDEYSSLYGLPMERRGVPTVFVADSYFVGDTPILEGFEEAVKEALGGCSSVDKTLEADGSESLDKEILGAAGGGISIVAVTVAALVDAINPCSMAILFFLMAGLLLLKKREKALKVGLVFTLSVFVANFLFGLGVLTTIATSGFSSVFQAIAGLIALLTGGLLIKDSFFYGSGGFVMEVPKFLRPYLKRRLSKAFFGRSAGPVSAFLIGFLVTLFEVPCTGGPYLYVLAGMADATTRMQTIPILFYYTLIFVMPLVSITFLFYFGSIYVEKATEWKERNKSIISLARGLPMVAIGLVTIPVSQAIKLLAVALSVYERLFVPSMVVWASYIAYRTFSKVRNRGRALKWTMIASLAITITAATITNAQMIIPHYLSDQNDYVFNVTANNGLFSTASSPDVPPREPYIRVEAGGTGVLFVGPNCPGSYNPRQGAGLTSVISCSWEAEGEGPQGQWAKMASSAAYAGSEIEPMTDTWVRMSNVAHTGSSLYLDSDAIVIWPQKVTMGPGFEDVLPWIEFIPIFIHWKVSHSVSGRAHASTTLCIKHPEAMAYEGCSFGSYKAHYGTGSSGSSLKYRDKMYYDDDIQWEMNIKTNKVRDDWFYIININEAIAGSHEDGTPSNGEAESVADPFVYVDPEWEFAPYFQVVQPAGVDNNTLVQVTRDWAYPDVDEDGYHSNVDCNDTDPAVNPGAAENCADGIDNDCDGNIDSADTDCGVCTDADADGVCDDTDNCPSVYNPEQLDHDNDGIGFLCDTDYDNDGVDNTVDNCRLVHNPDQADTVPGPDGDGVGDACGDYDDDGVIDPDDNCPYTGNSDQADLDGDGWGNACDSDADADGYNLFADCNDTDPAVNPGAAENCADGIDNDCDGYADFADFDCYVCIDSDGDGTYVYNATLCPIGNDCNDSDPTIIGVADNTYINYDVTVCPGSYGVEDRNNDGIFIFNASNVILDCNGTSISGADFGKGIYSDNFDNITIRNCNVKNCYDGICLLRARNSTLENSTVTSNINYGVFLGYGE